VNHFDNVGRAIAKGEKYDVVCFGHNHKAEITPVGKTLIINPGEIYGGLSGRSTFAIYNTSTARAELIEL
jgi:predicted phosphodiesterase